MASEQDGFKQRAKRLEERRPVDKKTITGMANPLRTEIQVILNEREASVNGLARDLGKSYNSVTYEVKTLREAGIIVITDERRVRGTVEVFYKAVKRAYIESMEWPSVPGPLQGGLRGSLLDNLTKDAIAAIEADTYDSVEGAHMSWTPGVVDDQGWEEIRDLLLQCLESTMAIFEKNKQRIIKSGAKGTAVTVSLLGYASTTPGEPIGPPPSQEEDRPVSADGSDEDASDRSQRKGEDS